jgi:hypothetical protein
VEEDRLCASPGNAHPDESVTPISTAPANTLEPNASMGTGPLSPSSSPHLAATSPTGAAPFDVPNAMAASSAPAAPLAFPSSKANDVNKATLSTSVAPMPPDAVKLPGGAASSTEPSTVAATTSSNGSAPAPDRSSDTLASFPLTSAELNSTDDVSPSAHPSQVAASAPVKALGAVHVGIGAPADAAEAMDPFVTEPSVTAQGAATAEPTSLLTQMDLSESMRQRHGWSVPWLPGLWLMPDGTRFGDGNAASSLLLSLQLYYEKESGVEWQCPQGVMSASHARSQRRQARPPAVRIAERHSREQVHYIPGYSEATSRAIPNMSVWEQLAEGYASWERTWTDPYSDDASKVIQVRTYFWLSLHAGNT